MAEKEKLSQEQKLQAVLYCLEHQLDYRRTSEQYKITYQQITPDGLRGLGPTIETMASAEGLDAHRNAVTIRLESL